MVEASQVAKRKYIVGGNWKCNGSVQTVQSLCETLNSLTVKNEQVEVVVAPISLHIANVKTRLNAVIKVASQNISADKNGAFTGEVSAEQVKDFDLEWTLVGHSERRKLNGETDAIVAKKLARA